MSAVRVNAPRGRAILALCLVTLAACTDVGTDPDAVVAVRFDGARYPSIVIGDSLRDSLGVLERLSVTPLNYRGDSVAANAVFSSPDTILTVLSDGVVYARGPKGDANPTRLFATIGSLQSSPDTLYVVPRADSTAAVKMQDTAQVVAGQGGRTQDSLYVGVYGDTASGKPKAPIPAWLVSYQVRYRGDLIDPADTSFAYVYRVPRSGGKRIPSVVDTTDAQGRAGGGRLLFVRSLPAGASEDTVTVIATTWPRQQGAVPLTSEITVIVRPFVAP